MNRWNLLVPGLLLCLTGCQITAHSRSHEFRPAGLHGGPCGDTCGGCGEGACSCGKCHGRQHRKHDCSAPLFYGDSWSQSCGDCCQPPVCCDPCGMVSGCEPMMMSCGMSVSAVCGFPVDAGCGVPMPMQSGCGLISGGGCSDSSMMMTPGNGPAQTATPDPGAAPVPPAEDFPAPQSYDASPGNPPGTPKPDDGLQTFGPDAGTSGAPNGNDQAPAAETPVDAVGWQIPDLPPASRISVPQAVPSLPNIPPQR